MQRVPLTILLCGLMAFPLTSAWGIPGDSTRQPGASVKGVDLAGKVSSDGKALIAEDDNVWSVSNAGALKGLEGRYVTVKCRMDVAKHAIRVFYVVQPLVRHSANLNDSAFRR
jgi:hypothetical protein